MKKAYMVKFSIYRPIEKELIIEEYFGWPVMKEVIKKDVVYDGNADLGFVSIEKAEEHADLLRKMKFSNGNKIIDIKICEYYE